MPKLAMTTALLLLLLGTGCSLAGDPETDDDASPDAGGGGGRVVLLPHDSFSLPKRLVADWEDRTGYTLVQRPVGDAGTLTNRLVLTKDSPTGDVVSVTEL